MNELFPVVGGLLAGIVIGWLPRRQTRLVWSIAIGSLVGGVATLASGEYRLSWYFVLIDTAIAIGAALSVSTRLGCPSSRLILGIVGIAEYIAAL